MRTMNTEEFSENIRLFSSVKKKDAQEQAIGQFGFDKPANSILFKRMLIEFTCLNTSNKTVFELFADEYNVSIAEHWIAGTHAHHPSL